MDEAVFLPADLARAARAFTKVSVSTIAQGAELSKQQVRNFEKGIIDLSADEKRRLKASLEKYGALFIPEDENAGYGVRRIYPREKFMRLNQWEDEGGRP